MTEPFPELLARLDSGAIKPIQLGQYPDGAPLVRSEHVPEGIRALLLRPCSLASFMAAMYLVDALVERGKRVPELILPLMPGARQDRINPGGDFLFTAKSIAREINARRFPSVTMLDPHSDVSAGLVDRARVLHAYACIHPPAGKYAAVVAPDGGAEKRAGAVARTLGVPLLHAWKSRSVETGAITGFGMELPMELEDGALVLVVDDLCDGGGTFIGLADEIDAHSLKAHLWVTHGLFTRGTAALLQRYGHLYCTDSAFGDREGVIEINVCERLLQGAIL